MDEAIACLAVMPDASDRVRRYAQETTQRRVVRGMGAYASEDLRNQISRWADAASAGDRASFNSAKAAMVLADPWGPSGPNWYTSVSNGGWYAYDQVTTMMSTTIPERHPNWLTAAGTVIGTGADIFAPGFVSQEQKNAAAYAAVQAGGGAGQQVGDVLSTGANIPGNIVKNLPSADAIKKIALAVVFGLIAVGAGYVAITSWARGRGMRQNSSGRGRRAGSSPRRRPRRGAPSYFVAKRRA